MSEATPSKRTRVLVVDDHTLVRSGLSTLLDVWGYDVVGQAVDGPTAVALVEELKPEIVFMDINMPGMSGIEATRIIKAGSPETRVVILTVSDDQQDLIDAIRSGADGYLLKNMEEHELEAMVGHLSRGEPVVPPALATKLLTEFRQQEAETVRELTEREEQVLREVASGATSREIGQHLEITENTVNFHLKNIFSKLHLRNRAQVVAWAAEHGYLVR